MGQTVDLGAAITHALRAPSLHNSQPWRWLIGLNSVELHADWTRHLPWTDPHRRDLVLSCGAALHHLQVALAAQDASVRVDRLPDPENSGHLATVTVEPGQGDASLAALYPAIARRRTERRRMGDRPVPDTVVRECIEQARQMGADLLPVVAPAMRQRLAAALNHAAHDQELSPGYPAELALWTGRYAGGHDGVSATNVAELPAELVGSSPLRRFPRAELRQPHRSLGSGLPDDGSELLVVITRGDDILAWLRAGEATSAVLLTATRAGLATTPLSQAVEMEASRHELRYDVLRVPEHPQLILRLGWAVTTAEELPVTPRRDLHSVLLHS
jgi:nitroreductase